MNRTLKRPMFKMGGAADGITSGLDKPKRGLVDEPGKYSQPEPMNLLRPGIVSLLSGLLHNRSKQKFLLPLEIFW
mgnify:CR=1 FL=1